MAEKEALDWSSVRLLVVTDGKAGDLAQCRGVTRLLGFKTHEVVVKPRLLARSFGFVGKDSAFDRAIPELGTSATIVIASGRRTVPYLKRLKVRRTAPTFTVFLKDPRTGGETADLIWVPTHDRLRGGNVFVTDTGPHGFQSEVTRHAASALETRLAHLPKPWLGVLLGGTSKRVTYEPETQARLVEAMKLAAQTAGSILVTPSRRTPPALLEKLRGIHPNLWVWDHSGNNPYAGLLGASDSLLVTGDSHNMVSEALSSGRQVMVYRPNRLPEKFRRFLDALTEDGLISEPQPMSPGKPQEPIDATRLIADRVREASEKYFAQI